MNARPNPAPGFKSRPDHRITIENYPGHVRVSAQSHTIAETDNALVLHEGSYAPVFYLPMRDVSEELLEPTAHETGCPFKGKARYWSIKTPEETIENAVWGYDDPYDEVDQIKGHVAFYASKVKIDVEPA